MIFTKTRPGFCLVYLFVGESCLLFNKLEREDFSLDTSVFETFNLTVNTKTTRPLITMKSNLIRFSISRNLLRNQTDKVNWRKEYNV